MLGKGAFGYVVMFEDRENPELKYAVKIMMKDELDGPALQLLRSEISILSVLEHDNVVGYVESFEDTRYLFIVMEYIDEP